MTTQPCVVRAAIADSSGVVHSVPSPGRHHDVIRIMVENGIPKPVTKGATQGFVLSDGRFVTRKAAAIVAIKAGQCKSVMRPAIGLLSEDVW